MADKSEEIMYSRVVTARMGQQMRRVLPPVGKCTPLKHPPAVVLSAIEIRLIP